ncbi:MAG TPA: hypothetical protein VMS37_33940 [Verrucomicrobiae bacterium]|nr:hypothetical protein [Verrucomicrobiae bacterium]
MQHTNQFAKVVTTAAALLAMWPASTFAQDAGTGAGDAGKGAFQAKVGELKQSLAANQKAIRQYTWTETTQISLKGEVKKTERKECRYSTDGQVIKTSLGDAAPPPAQQGGGRRRGGALKERVVEKKVDEMKDYMEDVAALVKQYVPPEPEKIQAAVQNGKAALNKESAPGIAELAFTDYVIPGDKLALSFNTEAKQLAAVNVDSYLGKEKDTVTLAVRFAALSDGVNYPAQTVLVAKAKQIQVTITNSGYSKQ